MIKLTIEGQEGGIEDEGYKGEEELKRECFEGILYCCNLKKL